MAHITVTMKDGTVHDFPHEGRAGGSYSKHLRYEQAFVVVIDEWGKETAFPASDIKQIEQRPERGGW